MCLTLSCQPNDVSKITSTRYIYTFSQATTNQSNLFATSLHWPKLLTPDRTIQSQSKSKFYNGGTYVALTETISISSLTIQPAPNRKWKMNIKMPISMDLLVHPVASIRQVSSPAFNHSTEIQIFFPFHYLLTQVLHNKMHMHRFRNQSNFYSGWSQKDTRESHTQVLAGTTRRWRQ